MLAAVAGYASLPLLIWAGTRDMSPLLFVSMWYVVAAVFWLGLAQTGFPKTKDRDKDLRTGRVAMFEDLKVIRFKYFAGNLPGGLAWLLFAMAVTFSDPSVVTVVFEVWPVLFALFTLTTFWRVRGLNEDKNQQDNKKLERQTSMMLVMLSVGAAGVSLVVLSDNEGGLSAWTQKSWLGLLFASLASVLLAVAEIAIQFMGADQRQETPNRVPSFVSASGGIIVRLILAPIFIIIGVVTFAVSAQGFSTLSLVLSCVLGFPSQSLDVVFSIRCIWHARSMGERRLRLAVFTILLLSLHYCCLRVLLILILLALIC